MTVFDTAWDLAKAWGEGFRVHGYSPKAPSVTELVEIYGGKGNKDRWGEYSREDLNPMPSYHNMSSGRGSGTGVSGTYYHGAPFVADIPSVGDKRPDLDKLLRLLESGKVDDDYFMHIPQPKNVIATTPKMRELSMELLSNVRQEGRNYGQLSQPMPWMYGKPQPDHEYFEQPITPKQTYRSGNFNSQPAYYALPKTLKDSVDLISSPYRREDGDFWYNIEDLIGGSNNESLGGNTLVGNRLFDYLGKTPLVQRVMGNDYGDIDDEEYNWVNDPEVLQVLGERMKDTGGLSPMNILLGEYGHDAVAPIINYDRGILGSRETTQGSVLLPPTTDNWWENYHPMSSGEFEILQPHHVENWIDELNRIEQSVVNPESTRLSDALKRRGWLD